MACKWIICRMRISQQRLTLDQCLINVEAQLLRHRVFHLRRIFRTSSFQRYPQPYCWTRCVDNDLHSTVSWFIWHLAFSFAFANRNIQYIPRNMHTVFALLCFVVVIHWLIFPYPSGLLHWHCGNLTIAPVPAKLPWWIWINISCEFIMNDCITTTKQNTTKPCAYFLGYTVCI